AYEVAVDEGSGVLVERFIRGNEHRLLVVGGKLAAAAKGQAASVVGDGKQTVQELITSQINSDPRRGRGEDQPLNPVRIDSAARLELTRQGFHADSVVPEGREVLIQRNGNVAFDCTDDVHPEVIAMAALAAKTVGLDVAGIDLVVEDISQPLHTQGGAIVEVNAGPGLLMHLKPASGLSRPVGRAIIDHIFPDQENGSIPLVGITGSHGTTDIAHLTHHLLSAHGWCTGLACTRGLYVGSRKLFEGDGSEWDQARRLLLNLEVEAAVIENSGIDILTKGLCYDRCSVGIVTDIEFDDIFKRADVAYHDFDTVEDLIKVYRTQVDVVWPHGAGVLNADDANVVSMAQYCDGEITLYSPSADSPALLSHLKEGKRAVTIEQRSIVLAHGDTRQILLSLEEIGPGQQTNHPEALSQCLAAVAAAWALDVPVSTIRSALIRYR
ncbi:MAG: Mur ligase family protein, partial [Zwartia sp.]